MAVPNFAREAVKDLAQAGEDAAADILDQQPTLGMSFLSMVNPAAVKVQEVGGEDAKTAQSKGGQVKIRLAK